MKDKEILKENIIKIMNETNYKFNNDIETFIKKESLNKEEVYNIIQNMNNENVISNNIKLKKKKTNEINETNKTNLIDLMGCDVILDGYKNSFNIKANIIIEKNESKINTEEINKIVVEFYPEFDFEKMLIDNIKNKISNYKIIYDLDYFKKR